MGEAEMATKSLKRKERYKWQQETSRERRGRDDSKRPQEMEEIKMATRGL